MASGDLSTPGIRPAKAALILAVALAWTAACHSGEELPGAVVLDGTTMGTSYRISVPGAGPADTAGIAAVIQGELDRVDSRMSTYRPESELSHFNRHRSTDPFPLSRATIEVLELAQSVSEATEGAFDVTVAPLVDAWGFGPREAGRSPSEESLDRLLAATGWTKLEVDGVRGTASKSAPELQCDLSGIAKGYAVDRIADILARLGFEDHLVEIGGEIRAGGSNPGGVPWRLGIERPDEAGRLVQRIVQVSKSGLATSGDYRNFRVIDGKRLSHVIDPRTGRPAASRVASATVLDPSAARADALATAMLVLGEQDGLELAERESLAALLIVRDGESRLREVASSRFRARMRAVQGDADDLPASARSGRGRDGHHGRRAALAEPLPAGLLRRTGRAGRQRGVAALRGLSAQ